MSPTQASDGQSFSLIELPVVMSLIAIVSAVLLPTIERIREVH